jgi:hypothetical protein
MRSSLHICDLRDVMNCYQHFHEHEGAHWENLPSGKVLVIANFRDAGAEEHFLNITKGSRISLPHPLHPKSVHEPISEEAAKHLHDHPHLFKEHEKVEHKLTAAKTCTVHDVIERMAKVNPKFRMF